MNFKLATAGLGLSVLLASAGSAFAAQQTTTTAAQTETRAQVDEAQQDCGRNAGALKRVLSAKSDIQRLYLAFDANDPLKAKIDNVVLQLNDAATTLEDRNKTCRHKK